MFTRRCQTTHLQQQGRIGVFWKKAVQSEAERRELFLTALSSEIIGLLVPQMMLLGLDQPGSAPLSGTFVSGRSRGYVFGIAANVLVEYGVPINDDEAFAVAVRAAFGTIFPQAGVEALAQSTIDAAREGHADVTEGFERADIEFRDRNRGQSFANAMGFWLYNNGIGD